MVDLGSLTGIVERSFDGLEDSRRRQLTKDLVRTIHDFVVRNNISHAEWRQSIEFLHRVGDISNESRSEFSLLSDVLGISSLVDLVERHRAQLRVACWGLFTRSTRLGAITLLIW